MRSMKNALKEIKGFMTDDDGIPTRFQLCNMAMLGLTLTMFGSSKIIVKALCAVGEGLVAYQMNKEMANFMEIMMHRR